MAMLGALAQAESEAARNGANMVKTKPLARRTLPRGRARRFPALLT